MILYHLKKIWCGKIQMEDVNIWVLIGNPYRILKVWVYDIIPFKVNMMWKNSNGGCKYMICNRESL